MQGFCFKRSLTQTSPDGRHALHLGIRFGYWPCLNAVFVQVAFWCWVFTVWHGDCNKQCASQAAD